MGGKPLFYCYSSLAELLAAVYPDYPWQVSKFLEAKTRPRNYFKDHSNFMAALEKAEEQLGILKV